MRKWKCIRFVLAVWLALSGGAAPAAGQGSDPPPLNAEQLDQLVAPVALYPDSLLAQIFMASTYPLEVVEAARWAQGHSGLEGDKLEDALEGQTWDASVKSLVAFPQVLTMMNDKLDWTQKLGDAFLAQQKDVMAAVQRLRAKAKAEGNLESNEQQKVVVQQAPSSSTTVIEIQPANPQVVYVPTYNPTVVYGAWPYPAYPPYSYYPPGYVAGSVISFGVGMAVGAALWGNCNWGYGNVDINVNRYNEFNRTNISNKNWQHNVEHRKGVGYRDSSTRQRYRGESAQRTQSREQFRGRAETGRQQLARGDADRFKGSANRAGTQGARREGAARERPGGSREAAARGQRGAGQGYRNSGGSRSAFDGVGRGGEVRQQSQRGWSSRESAARHAGARSGGGFGGGGRDFGGGGGGGGRTGGGRGRR